MAEHIAGKNPDTTAAASRSPFRLGDVVDERYLIDGYIARGGMSIVYRAIDLRLDRPVALKVLRPDLVSKEEFRERFVSEAKTVANLHGLGIVGVMDQGMWNGNAFLVMELVAGGTVRELLTERGPMPLYAAVAVIQPALEALAVAHASGFVHQDVKPENILISHNGTIKVADFGLVQAANRATSDKRIIGTLAYLSPEQLERKKVDQRSDVYSAGLVLYELLVGQPPFGMPETKAAAKKRLIENVPAASAQRPGIPAEVDSLIEKATQRDPQKRFDNAEDMAKAVRELSLKLRLPAFTVPTPQQSAEQTSAATALSTSTGTTEIIGADGATEIIGADGATEIIPSVPNATAVLTSPVVDDPLPGLPGLDDNATELVDLPEEDSLPDAATAFLESNEDDEPLTPEELYALQLASHPRLWPVLVWLLVLALVVAGLATGMYQLGTAVVQPTMEPAALISDAASLIPGMPSLAIAGY